MNIYIHTYIHICMTIIIVFGRVFGVFPTSFLPGGVLCEISQGLARSDV